jgi:Flp pilus assembly protein TadD
MLQAGDAPAAIADYSEALLLDPAYTAALQARGDARLATGDVFGAIDDYSQALAIQPNDAAVYSARGAAYLQVNKPQEAYQDLTQAIQLSLTTADPELFYNRGVARASLGDDAGARRDFEEAAELYLQQGEAAGYRQTLDQMSQL